MTTATSLSPADTTFHAVQRRLTASLPAGVLTDAGASLETVTLGMQDAPRLITARVVEGKSLRAHPVARATSPVFGAFLDGTQVSRPIAHADGIPLVHGTTAAVVRRRAGGRLGTWQQPLLDRRLYAPLGLLPAEWRSALDDADLPVVDTLEGRDVGSPHPFALQEAAIHAVQNDREALERSLAERWCAGESGILLVDGSISGSETVASAACVVGVIKSHRTLYAEDDALRAVLRLEAGERSSVFRITTPRRTAVASWYLRLRREPGRDPLWGLVRIEVADVASTREATARADAVSGWVLAEALPLSIPDARWDKMVYGIRDCEEFLRAIQ